MDASLVREEPNALVGGDGVGSSVAVAAGEDVVRVGVGDGSRSRAEGLVLLVGAICSGAASCVFGACVEGAIFGLAWIFSSAWFLVRGGCRHGGRPGFFALRFSESSAAVGVEWWEGAKTAGNCTGRIRRAGAGGADAT